ncbi:hypothetical protein QWZ03_16040 [Chitinimonas viridis]|uniref:DUF202 domain-containing protein n=1 Tax=Chitinimonas viridis TaxID=664880 RepID=A0ABT8B8B3_9NEIS|nr:hypothetical protein [Chitinimonas viridis]MDN3578280.1 hypothetical protein [Chitinimonas viridis]
MTNIEKLKQKHALALEAQRWEYRTRELQFLEAGQHQRALNQLMWQVPGMAIAITGGLWYGATTLETEAPRVWVFGFTAIVDFLTVVILWRIRSLIEVHIEHQRGFSPPESAEAKSKCSWRWACAWPKRTVITCWTIALLAAAAVSIAGAFHPSAVSKPKTQEPTRACCNVSIDLPTQRCEVPLAKPALPAQPARKRTCHR